MRRWIIAVLVLLVAVPAAWADTLTTKTPQKVIVQNTPTADGDTGGGTQPVTLFGIALPASGGVVFGGTATNPFIISGTVAATQSGTWTMQPGNTANTTPWLFSISQGGNTAAVNASSQLSVNCANCTGSGVSQQDNTGYTAGTTNMVPVAGFVGSTSVTSGNAGALQMTADRMLFTNLGKVGGTAFALGQTTMSASLPVTLANNQSTLPVSLASVPSHAVTNAGTFATQIDGAALTALQLIDNIVNTLGSTTSGQSGVLGLGAVTTSAPSYTTAQTNALSLTPAGELRVRMESTAVGSTSTDDDGDLPSGTTGMTEVITRMYGFNSDSATGRYTRWSHQPLDFDSGAGTENLSVIGIGLPASGGPVIGGTSTNPFNVVFPSAQAITVASLPLPTGAATEATLANALTSANFAAAFGTAGSADAQVMSIQGIASMTPVQVQSNSANIATQTTLASILTAVELIDNAVSGAGFNVTQLGGTAIAMNTGTRSAGTQRVTIATDDIVPVSQSGTWTVQPGNTANTTPWLMSAIPATSGGTTPCYITSAASTNATNCKASAGQLYSVEAVNTTATLYYLRLYNLASAPTCSSATGFVRTIPVPPQAAAGGAGGIVIDKSTGEAYGTGVGFCLTGGGSSTDNTNAATGVYVTLNYK